jgi:UDP-4-amino-4-deoxy-L-arabinose formyltransferase/UDP-glucuronic acid dehydrogenase (UDP-4-keto-hexauronic acid decarboxylating)
VRDGLPLIAELLAACARDPGSIPRIEQDLTRREVLLRKPPGGGVISWERSAQDLGAFLRAADFHPFPSPWGHGKTLLGERELEVVRAVVAREPAAAAPGVVTRVAADGALVACGEGSLLLTLVRLDGRYLRAGEVLAAGTRLWAGR